MGWGFPVPEKKKKWRALDGSKFLQICLSIQVYKMWPFKKRFMCMSVTWIEDFKMVEE